jgi:outer membrane protein assembly factor BamB
MQEPSMLRRCLCLLPPLAAVLALSAPAADNFDPRPFDWPQWLGPDRTAVSRETDLLREWPKGGPPLLWKIDNLGRGYSTPTVAAGRIFTMGNRGKTEYVLAFAEDGGKELWATEVGPVRSNGGGPEGPRCSPAVDGHSVYALGLNGDLLCLEAATGREVWRKDLVKQFGGRVGGWGYSESPLIDGDRLICTPGGDKATLLALNKKTGEEIWKGVVPRHDHAHYSSIIAIEVGGKRQYVQFLSGGVVGLSADGEFLWRYDKPHNDTANCSTPIFHDDFVFAASDYGTGGGLARLSPDGANKVRAEEVYFTRDMKNHHGGMVLVGDYLYGDNGGRLTCLEFKTGKVMWSSDRAGKGSIAAAGRRLYYRNEHGPMILVEANAHRYVEHGRFDQPHRSNTSAWPHPVIANGKLYLRDQELLLCYDIKKK